MKEDKFHFFMPVDFEKGTTKDELGNDVIKISGIISNNEADSDGEMLDADGFDFERFLSTGNINYNHKSSSDPSAIIGHPTTAKVLSNQPNKPVYMEGVLYADLDKTKDIVKLSNTLKKHGRSLGFSIEGKATKRDPLNPKRIQKATLTAVAITATPKNTGTSMNIMKGGFDDILIDEFDIQKSEANGGDQYIIDVTDPNTNVRCTVDKNFCIKVEKAMTTSNSGGIVKEDLEGKEKKLNDVEIRKSIVVLATANKQGKIGSELLNKYKKIIKGLM